MSRVTKTLAGAGAVPAGLPLVKKARCAASFSYSMTTSSAASNPMASGNDTLSPLMRLVNGETT